MKYFDINGCHVNTVMVFVFPIIVNFYIFSTKSRKEWEDSSFNYKIFILDARTKVLDSLSALIAEILPEHKN